MAVKKALIENLRNDYRSAELSEKDVKKDPFAQFEQWFTEALSAGLYEPNAMTLATAGPDRKPYARIVLLKGFDKNGFVFYTNYLSAKGKELAKNPFAALVFYWPELERQVRIEGAVEKLDKASSDAYFQSRPRASQIGAVISPQSREIPGRQELEQAWTRLENDSLDQLIQKPSHWGGYIVKPQIFEFWQGRTSRLHDRIVYKRSDKAKWKILRLAP